MIRRSRLALWGLVACVLFVAHIAPASAHGHTVLDDWGVHVLGTCETDNRPHLEGYFDGEHQWLLETWNLAVRELGWNHLENLTPNHVDQQTQRLVARSWWSSSQHAGPQTQWPNCYDDALRAMGHEAPCIGRNVYGCGATHGLEPAVVPEVGAETNPPVPSFTGMVFSPLAA